MKFTFNDLNIIRSLLANGTAAGPVTQEMIDLAVLKYENACKLCKHSIEEIGWCDFIGPAREQIERENGKEKVVNN